MVITKRHMFKDNQSRMSEHEIRFTINHLGYGLRKIRKFI